MSTSNAADERRPPATSGRETAIRGWRSHLAVGVSIALAFEALTGLWLYFAPFSVASQVQLLLHTIAGLALLAPFVVYQVAHLRDWWRQRVTASMVLGYALLAAVLVCVVSGLVLTWEAWAGPRMSPGWDLTHLVSGIAVAALLPAHLIAVFLRRRIGAIDPHLASAQRVFGLRGATGLALGLGSVIAGALTFPAQDYEFPIPDGYAFSDVAQQYDMYRDNPFAPSNAQTEHGLLIDSTLLSGSESCGTSGCHEEILGEWQPSAHRFAAANPPFQAVQKSFATDREPAETRYCAGCHDPISLFAGAKDMAHLDLSAPGMQEGISCVVCHSISMADTRGNADYRLTPPVKYIGEGSSGWKKAVSDFLIRAYPRQHLADYDRNLLRTPEFCAACHKQFIPEALNRFGLTEGQNQYDEWRNGHWHSEDPESDLTCNDCHMRLVESDDPGAGEAGAHRRATDDGKHRHHGFIAANSFMPEVMKLPNWERHAQLTREWVRGETVLPEIDDVWPRGPVAGVRVDGLPESVAPGGELQFRVVVTNRKAGHNFITGPLDFVRSWVHLTITDADGRLVAERGAIDPKTRRITDEAGKAHESGSGRASGTLVFEAAPVDAEGNELEKHELWKKAGGKGKRVLFPRFSDAHVYKLTVPADAKGPLTIRADLNYRRYRQKFLDTVVPEMERETGVHQATLTQDTVEAVVGVAPGARK